MKMLQRVLFTLVCLITYIFVAVLYVIKTPFQMLGILSEQIGKFILVEMRSCFFIIHRIWSIK